MPFKGTDKQAYKKAAKFPKVMRSSVYKIIKSYNKSLINGFFESKNKQKKNLMRPNQYQLNYVKGNKESTTYVYSHAQSNLKCQLIISNSISNLAIKKIKEMSQVVFIKLSEYILENSIQVSSRTIHILISFGKIVIQASNIYEDNEKYEILFEVINGEMTMNENYEELKAFIKIHFDLLNQIFILSKDIIESSIV